MIAFRMRVRHKIVGSILLVVGAALLSVVYFLFADVRTEYERIALELQSSQVEGYAQRLSLSLNLALSSLHALANELEGVEYADALQRLNTFDEQAARLQNATPQFLAVWAKLDYRYLNPTHRHFNGSMLVGYYGQGDAARRLEELVDTSGLNLDAEYIARRDGMEVYTTGPGVSGLEREGRSDHTFTLGIPYRDKSRIPAGVVGAEVRSSFYETLISSLQVREGVHCVLLSPTMQIVAGFGGENVGNTLGVVFGSIPRIGEYEARMAGGELVRGRFRNRVTGEDGFFLSAPIWVGSSSSPWSLCLVSPKEESMHSPARMVRVAVAVLFLGLLLILGLLLLLTRSLGAPIRQTVRSLTALSRGSIDRDLRLSIRTGDEVESIAEATNRLLTSLTEKSHFALQIGQGNLNASFSVSGEDALGQSLLEMQRSLSEAEEREERQRKLDDQQAWVTRGIATFSDLLRAEATSIEDFSYSIVRELSNYAGLLVGAFYLKEERMGGGDGEADGVYLRMLAMHAYDVRKFSLAEFALGEGVVGRCAQEETLLQITDLPRDYMRIESGLGGAHPDTLLLVPVLMNGVLLGVMEFACFGTLPEYKVGLIENVAGSFASTLVTVQNSIQTKSLLREAQRRSEAMSAQEEQMLQSREEMLSMEAESRRQRAELESLEEAIRSACYVVEYDLHGVMVRASDEYLKLLRVSPSALGKSRLTDGMVLDDTQRRELRVFWKDVVRGQVKRHVRNQLAHNGEVFHFVETYAPVRDSEGRVVRVLKFAFDVTNLVQERGSDQ